MESRAVTRPAAASTIGDFLTQNGLATVTVAAAEVPITSQWGMNQAKMFKDSAADFSAYIATESAGNGLCFIGLSI